MMIIITIFISITIIIIVIAIIIVVIVMIIIVLWLYLSCERTVKSICFFVIFTLRIQLFDRMHIRQTIKDAKLNHNSISATQDRNNSERNNPTHDNIQLHCNNVWFPTDLPWVPVSGIDQRVICLFSVIQSSSLLNPNTIYSLWLKHFKNAE